MDFEQKTKRSSNEEKYHMENLHIARDFSKQLILEMNELVRSIVLFGSNTHDTLRKDSDIDIMVVLNNVSVYVSPELREAYKIIVQKLNSDIGQNKIHIMTVNLSDLWDMARKGDPLLINVLRYGVALFDRDLIDPLQYLLEIGRMRPSREAVYNYTARSETLLDNVQKHIHDAILDLYYATVDIVHASIMIQGVSPPSPKEMPTIFKKTFKGKSIAKYAVVIEEIYDIAKKIEHNKAPDIKGSDIDKLRNKVQTMIKELRTFNEKEMKQKDLFEI